MSASGKSCARTTGRGGPASSGKEADEEVGLVYFGERYLIPRIGRWASPDPLSVHAAGGGEAGNSYHYVSGNLLQARDPLGLWSTMDKVIWEPVHQMAVENALADDTDAATIAILQKEQVLADQDQAPLGQFKHAMHGIDMNSFKQDSHEQVVDKMEAYTRQELLDARTVMTEKNVSSEQREGAVRSIGRAMHLMQDATSPSHRGAQHWVGASREGANIVSKVVAAAFDYVAMGVEVGPHTLKENKYPSGDDAVRLEAATQWAWDLGTGRAAMPDRFFDDDGHLLIPQDYLDAAAEQMSPSSPPAEPKPAAVQSNEGE